MDSKMFDFDLQLFAEGDDGAGKGDDGKNDDGKKDPGADDAAKEKAAKEAQEAALKSKIEEAVAKAQERWEKEYQKKVEAEKKEKERLSKLSEEERKQAEAEKREKELADKEADLKRKELKLEMVKVLAERDIPVQFMDYLVAEDNQSTLNRITEFEKAYKKAIEDAVNEKLKGKAPASGSNPTDDQRKNAGVSKSGFFDAIYKNQSKR